MPIPNVATLYQRIHSGSEGGNEFARFVKLLLIAHFDSIGHKFLSESDASGDFKKVDAIVIDPSLPSVITTGFQFKFFPAKLSPSQKKTIEDSIVMAMKENTCMDKFILVTPEEFYKEQEQWWENIKVKYEHSFTVETKGICYLINFQLIHWGHERLVELSLKHAHIGIEYFPELFPRGVGALKLLYAGVDCIKSAWHSSEKTKGSFYQSYSDKEQLTTDPLFDFQFANNTS